MPPKASKKTVGYSDSIEPLCPFTGEKLTLIRHDQTGMWRAQGSFYFTRFFDFKQELVHHLLTRGGKAPDFDKRPSVTVTEKTAPPLVDPVADLVAKDRKIQDRVNEYVEVNQGLLGLKR